jgi:hypothetical protein
MSVFGAVIDRQQNGSRGQALDEAIKDCLGLGVEPV